MQTLKDLAKFTTFVGGGIGSALLAFYGIYNVRTYKNINSNQSIHKLNGVQLSDQDRKKVPFSYDFQYNKLIREQIEQDAVYEVDNPKFKYVSKPDNSWSIEFKP